MSKIKCCLKSDWGFGVVGEWIWSPARLLNHKQIKNWDSPGHQVNKIVTRILTFRSDESEIKTLTNTPPHPPFPKHPFSLATDVVPFHYWCQSGIWLTCVQYNTSTVFSKIESWIKSSTTFWCQISSIIVFSGKSVNLLKKKSKEKRLPLRIAHSTSFVR